MKRLFSPGRYGALPFRAKLTALTAFAVAFALLLSCLGMYGMQYFSDRFLAERRHEQIAQVIAANIGAAMLFSDKVAARENLASVDGIDDIGPVQALTAKNELFAEFETIRSSDVDATYWQDELRYPIMVDQEQVGELRMKVHYRSVADIAVLIAPALAIIFLICLAMAIAVSHWMTILAFRPIGRLVSTMREISRSGDFKMRVASEPDPDFDTIVSSFNTMLGEVESRNAALTETAEALGRARDDAESANIAKSQFLANMSHELRTPLNAILGYTEVLQEELVAAKMERSVEDVQWIYSSARQLLVLINGILDLSKIEAGKMDIEVHEFDVANLMREVAAMLEPIAAQKGNVLHVQIDPSLGTASTDSNKLRQCLLNLGSNACKFTEQGHIFILGRVEEGELVFSISDTGIGMAAEELQRLFRPFMQADASTTRRYGGTGLGLTITARFAEMLGGDIAVESVPDEGTAFTLRIAADMGRAGKADDSPEVSLPEALDQTSLIMGGKPLALIVDDEPSAVQLLTRMATQAGYEAVFARDGEEGVALARQCRPDVILLDIGMPNVNGWEVLEQLEGDGDLKKIPTVVVTVDDDRRRALTAGASDHLLKPISRTELNDILGQYARKQSGKVLIVEDDEATARLHERGISQMGYQTAIATNGRDALRLLEEGNFGFVVTDLRMPDGDGFELVDAISHIAEEKRPLVIVVTGMVLDEDEASKIDGKFVKLLPKNGLSPRILADSVARAFALSFEELDGISGQAA